MTNETAEPKRLALIDRDGTIIVDKVYLSDPVESSLPPARLKGSACSGDSGFTLALITNQSGIARGYFNAATLERIHERLQSMLGAEGIGLKSIYICPHGPDDECDCRKPAPGMVLRAMRDLGFRADQVVFIGDSDVDMGAAAAAGVAGVWVASPGKSSAIDAAADFLEAAQRACALIALQEGREASN